MSEILGISRSLIGPRQLLMFLFHWREREANEGRNMSEALNKLQKLVANRLMWGEAGSGRS